MKISNLNYIVLFSFLSLLFSSCEKEAKNVDVPVVQPQLVVAGFLSPSAEPTKVVLSWSAPIYHNTHHDKPMESNAKVFISDGANEYQLTYNSMKEYYSISKANMPVVVGKKYSLRVESDRSKTLTSESFVPSSPDYSIQYLGKDSVKDEYDNNVYYRRYFLKLKINNSEPTAFYRIKAWQQVIVYGNEQIEPMYMNIEDNMIVHGDVEKTIILEDYRMMHMSVTKQIYINLEKVDETYYRYHNALSHYQGVDIFTEPTLVYSNVENGLGVFCSYHSVMDSVVVK